MKRAPSKKAMERRKKPRSATVGRKPAPRLGQSQKLRLAEAPGLPTSAQGAGPQSPVEAEETCQNCGKVLVTDDRALFVEEEIGRIFCAESCITAYFSSEIERLEKEYYRRLSRDDLTQAERESYAHLRWITLQEPDEIWREKTLSGDHRYTLISEFRPGASRIWCVCICLFLKGEPSFLYMAFTTRNAGMVATYRRGERVEWAKEKRSGARGEPSEPFEDTEAEMENDASTDASDDAAHSDRLADDWTDDETFLAEVNQERREDDIPAEEFPAFERCLEETLETPDEVWSCRLGQSSAKLYHFIRHYKPDPDDEQGKGYWYVIVARELEDDEQIEVVDAFPTRDTMLVDRYRRGEQEVGHTAPGPSSRVVH